MAGLKVVAQEWVCPEHGGWAASKAVSWLMRHAVDPQAVRGALVQEQSIAPLLEIANAGGLRAPTRIRVSRAGKYPQVIGHEFDDREDAA
jgi:hypothetical protein